MSGSISKTVPAVIKERKQVWAKPCIKSKNCVKMVLLVQKQMNMAD